MIELLPRTEALPVPIALVAVDIDELVTTERVGILLRALLIKSLRREKMTTAAISRLLRISWHCADTMLCKLECVIPELRRDMDGWRLDLWCLSDPDCL